MLIKAIALLFFVCVSAKAATINAASTSSTHVQVAIDSASNGDIVSVPTGSSTWTTDVNSTGKRITIQGAGFNNTIITVDGDYGFTLSGTVRLTGFKMIYDSGPGLILISGLGYRIDRCRFESPSQSTAISVVGFDINQASHGLVDLCEFVNMSSIATGYDLQDYVGWATPNVWGTTNANYFERNQYVNTVFNNSMDANYCGKYVFRYNIMIDSSVEAHSVQGSGRATKSWEIYMNSLIQSNRSMNFPLYLRGGTGVAWSNIVYGSWSNPDGYINNIRSDEFRFAEAGGYPSDADGGSIYDGNLTNGIDRATGAHTGANNASVLTDSGQSWTVNEFTVQPPDGTNRWIRNITDGSKGKITANTATTITVTLAGGTDNDFDNGDQYEISAGYPARDQIGMGYDFIQGAALVLYPQVLEIAYFWENRTSGGTLLNMKKSGANNTAIHLVEGRNYTNGIVKPGYTPLVFPHPLATAQDAVTNSVSVSATGGVSFSGGVSIK